MWCMLLYSVIFYVILYIIIFFYRYVSKENASQFQLSSETLVAMAVAQTAY